MRWSQASSKEPRFELFWFVCLYDLFICLFVHSVLPCRTAMSLGRWFARSAPPTITTTNFTQPRSPQMEPINAALAAIEALESGEKPVHTQIARTFGVERTTLARRHQGQSATKTSKHSTHNRNSSSHNILTKLVTKAYHLLEIYYKYLLHSLLRKSLDTTGSITLFSAIPIFSNQNSSPIWITITIELT